MEFSKNIKKELKPHKANNKHRYEVFIKSDYVRDAQAYVGDCLSDDIDIFDEEHERFWNDCNGHILVFDGYAESIEDVKETLKKIYPDASDNIFYIKSVNKLKTAVNGLVEHAFKRLDEMEPELFGGEDRPLDFVDCGMIDGEYNALITVLDLLGVDHMYNKQ